MFVEWVFLVIVFLGSLFLSLGSLSTPTIFGVVGGAAWACVTILCLIAESLLVIRAAVGRWERGEKLKPKSPVSGIQKNLLDWFR